MSLVPKALRRCATSIPIRPRPTTPTTLSATSTPVYFERFHAPPLSASLAGAMCRALGEQQGDGELGGRADVGRRGVDDHDARLGRGRDVHVVQPDARAGDDLEPPGGRQGLRVHLGGRADEDGIDVGDGGEQVGAIGAVAVADLEVGAQRLHGGGAELLGDQDDGLGHGVPSGPKGRSAPGQLHGFYRALGTAPTVQHCLQDPARLEEATYRGRPGPPGRPVAPLRPRRSHAGRHGQLQRRMVCSSSTRLERAAQPSRDQGRRAVTAAGPSVPQTDMRHRLGAAR